MIQLWLHKSRMRVLRQLAGEDGNKDNVVDAEHDLENRQRDETDPRRRLGQEAPIDRRHKNAVRHARRSAGAGRGGQVEFAVPLQAPEDFGPVSCA
jgi:hypothetical protein